MNRAKVVAWGLWIVIAVVASFYTTFKEPNTCSMSFSRPVYHQIPVATPYSKMENRYSTYLYREGGTSPHWDGSNVESLGGTPVLFIPGNAGSYSQGRSVASLAANLGKELGSAAEFDFFLVHFNEDFSAFRGKTLADEAGYINDAIYHILDMYSGHANAPQSVILICHSMGGTVARVLVTLDNYVPNSVNTIFTLATPHLVPPLTMDRGVTEMYDRVSQFWRQSFSEQEDSRLEDMTVVSISGGHTDYMIPPEYTPIFSVMPPSHAISAYSYSIPNVWRGQDHLAIVWCSELRQVLVESMFAVVDPHRPQRTIPFEDRMRVLRRYYKSPLDDKDLMNVRHALLWSPEPFAVGGHASFATPIGSLVIVSNNTSTAVTTGGPHTKIPFAFSDTGYVSIVKLLLGIEVPVDAKFMDIPLPALQSSLIALRVTLEGATSTSAFRLWVPSTGEARWFSERESDVFWYSSSPYVPYPVQAHDCLHLQVVAPTWTAADGPMTLRVRINWWASLANLVLRYRTTALCFPAGIVLVIVLIQLHSTLNGTYVSFRAALQQFIRHYFVAVVLASMVVQHLLSFQIVRNLIRSVQIPSERQTISALRSSHFDIADLFAGVDEPVLAFVAPLLLTVSTTFVILVDALLGLVTDYAVGPAHRLLQRFTCRVRVPKREWLEWAALACATVVVPHQCVFVSAAVYHLLSTTDARSWKFTVLMVLFWTAAVDIPILAVWFKDFGFAWNLELSSVINFASSAPSVAYVYLINHNDYGINMYPCACPNWMRACTYGLIGYFAYYALMHGFMHTFMMHYFANLLAGWLIFIACVNDTPFKKTL